MGEGPASAAKLWKMRRDNITFRVYSTELIEENKWRAVRYGLDGKMIDLGKQREVPVRELLHELIDWFLRDVIDDLGIRQEVQYAYKILEGGSSADRQIEEFARKWEEDGLSHWATVELESGELIGRIGLMRHHDWPLEPSPVEVGWVLHQEYWGRGLATEGGRASMELWRELLRDDTRLLSITAPENDRSQAVMRRLGLTYRGTAQWHDRDVVWYAEDR